MKTKEKILHESLMLFSQKGYSGTTIKDIAQKVAIKDSSIYKHFVSKQEILDNIVKEMENKMFRKFTSEAEVDKPVFLMNNYTTISYEQTCEFAWKLFSLYTKDPEISAYRKLLMQERFHDSYMAKLYDDFFLSGPLYKERKIFEEMIMHDILEAENTRILTLHFYGVILTLTELYDCHPDMEEEIRELLCENVLVLRKHYYKKNL